MHLQCIGCSCCSSLQGQMYSTGRTLHHAAALGLTNISSPQTLRTGDFARCLRSSNSCPQSASEQGCRNQILEVPSERNSTQAWLAGFDSKQSGEGPLDYLQTHAHTLEKFFWQDKLTFIDVHFNLSTCVEVNVASNLYFIFSCRKNYGQFSLFNKSLGTS